MAGISGLSAYASYYREYSAGWAKTISRDLDIGFHGKLIFGKANGITTRSRNSLYTDPAAFDLTLESKLRFNISSPMSLQFNPDGLVGGMEVNQSVPEILFNRENIGVAVDAGFIKTPSDDVTWSGSVIDLGFVCWKTNPYHYEHDGGFFYDGPLGDTLIYSNYSDNIYSEASDELNANWEQKNYIAFMAPRIYLGYQKKINNILSWSATGAAKVYRYKIIPGLTVGLDAKFTKNIAGAVSFSYLEPFV
ncbi:MAG: hypothetical protein HC905_03840 [Bacteroidales bacterium]|nr:hypothetical protein [Bacteroidales bacterium]